MKQALSRKLILFVTGATILVASVAFGITKVRSVMNGRKASATRLERLPRVMLWAWERPTDLRFINPEETGVAFLAQSIRLRSGEVEIRPRLQPLNLPEGARVMAVARVETEKPQLSTQQREKLAGAIANMARLPNVSNIQIDFDATKSERAFYRDVIVDVRRRLPDTVSLSMTALASWCTYDNWLSDLPIDEAVPMLFRMAGDGKQIARRLDAGDDFIAPPCRHSYGISTDEPRSSLSSARRLYVFSPDPWTEPAVRAILESRK
ncbi:MAG TPA: hypothetical protein VK582_10175 [Pyrinomonadaceae bacterium]|nr:hypothetical protein [Pyrinomonadaceae bacterium]